MSPGYQDVFLYDGILKSKYMKCSLDGHTLTIDASKSARRKIPGNFGVRSSDAILMKCLEDAREAQARFTGGCTIGKHPSTSFICPKRRYETQIRETDGELYAEQKATGRGQ